MTIGSYQKYQIITAESFNYLRRLIMMIYDIGYGDRGYGQHDGGSTSATVNAVKAETHPSANWPHYTNEEFIGDLITWLPWAQIRNAMNVCLLHQQSDTTNEPAEEAFDQGKIVKAFTAGSGGGDFPGSIDLSDYNRLTFRPESVSIFGPAAYSSRNTPWQTQIKHCIQVTFRSGDDARYFFNSGGQFRFVSNRTGSTNQPQDRFWTAFLDKIGMVAFDYGQTFPTSSKPRTGSYTDIGYYELTTFLQRIYWADGGDIDVGQRTEMIFKEGNRVTITTADAQSRADGVVDLNTQVMMQVGSTTTDMKLSLCQSPSIKEACARSVEKISTPSASGSDSADTISHFDSHLYSWTSVYMYETGDEHQMRVIKNAYGMNTFEIWAKTNSIGPGANGDRGNVLYFEVVFNDIHSNGVGGYDFCTGLFESTMYYQKATRYLGVQDPACQTLCTLTDTEGPAQVPKVILTVNDAASASGEWSDTYTYKWSVQGADVFNTFMTITAGICIIGSPGGAHYNVDEIPWYNITTTTGTISVSGIREQAGCTYRITLEAIDSATGFFNTASVYVTYQVCTCPIGFLTYNSTTCQQIYKGPRGPGFGYNIFPVTVPTNIYATPSSDFNAIAGNAVWITSDSVSPAVYEGLWAKLTLSFKVQSTGSYTFQFACNKIGLVYLDNSKIITTVNPLPLFWTTRPTTILAGEHTITLRIYNQPLEYPSVMWSQNPVFFALVLKLGSTTIVNAKTSSTYSAIRFLCPDDGVPYYITDPLVPMVSHYLVPVSQSSWVTELQDTALWISNDGASPREMKEERDFLIHKDTTVKKQQLFLERSLNNWTENDEWVIVVSKDINYNVFENDLLHQGIKILHDYELLDHYLIEGTEKQIKKLQNDPRVLTITHNHLVNLEACSSQVLDLTTSNWGLYAIAKLDLTDYPNIPANQDYTWTKSGDGVDVVILDTGINFNHVEFDGRTKSVIYDIQADTNVTSPPSFYTRITSSDSSYGTDCCGHGSHVAGIATGNHFGVAKGAFIRCAKIFILKPDDGTWYCELGWILLALNGIISWHNAKISSSSNTPTVMNASVGASSSSLKTAFQNAMDAGIVIAAAAGNSGIDLSTDTNFSPANDTNAVTVGAVQIDATNPSLITYEICSFSNYGAVLDVFAPGNDIRSVDYSSNTGSVIMGGTSMACPFVTGVLAQWSQGRSIASTNAEAQAANGFIVNQASSSTAFYLPSSITDTTNRFLISPYICQQLAPGTTSDDIRTIGMINIGKTAKYTLQCAAEGIALFFIDGEFILDSSSSATWVNQDVNLIAGAHYIECIARNTNNGITDSWSDNPAGFGFKLYDDSNQLIYTSRTDDLMKVHFECKEKYLPNYSGGNCVQYNSFSYLSFVPNKMIPVRHALWNDTINAVAVWASIDGVNPLFADSRWIKFNIYFTLPGTGTTAIAYTFESGADDRYKLWIDGSLITQHDAMGWFHSRVALKPGGHTMQVEVKNTPNGYEGWENNPLFFGFNIKEIDTAISVLSSRDFDKYACDFIPGDLEYIGGGGYCVRTLYTPCTPNNIACFHYIDGVQNQGFGWTLNAAPYGRTNVTVANVNSYTIWASHGGSYDATPLEEWVTFYYSVTFPVDDIYHMGLQGKDEAQIWIDDQEILSVIEADGYQEVILGYKAGVHLVLVKVINHGSDSNWTNNPAWVTGNIRRSNGVLVWTTTDSSYKQPKQLYFDNEIAEPEWVVGNYFYTTGGWIAFDEEQYISLNYDVWYAVNSGHYMDGTPCPGLTPAKHFILYGAWESTFISSRCLDNDTALLPPNCAKYLDKNENREYGFTLKKSNVERTERLIGMKIVQITPSPNHYYYTLYRGNQPALPEDVENQLIFTTLGWITWTSSGYLAANPDVKEALASGYYADNTPVPSDITPIKHYMTRGLDPDVAWTRCVGIPSASSIPTPTNPTIVQIVCHHYVDSTTNKMNGWTLSGPQGKTLFYHGQEATIDQVNGALFWTNTGIVQFIPSRYRTSNRDLAGLTDDQVTEEFITEGAWQGTQQPPRCMWVEEHLVNLLCYNYVDTKDNWDRGWTLGGTDNKVLYFHNKQATVSNVVGATFMTSQGLTVFDPVYYKEANSDLATLSNLAATQQFIIIGAWQGTQTPPRCMAKKEATPAVLPDPIIVKIFCYAYVDDVANRDNGWTINSDHSLYYWGSKATIDQVNGSVFMTTLGLQYFSPEDYKAANADLTGLTDDQATQQFIDEGAWDGSQDPPRCMYHREVYQKKICYLYIDGTVNQTNGWQIRGKGGKQLFINGSLAKVTDVVGARFMTTQGWMEFDAASFKSSNSDLSNMTDTAAAQYFIDIGAWESAQTNSTRCLEIRTQEIDKWCYSYVDTLSNRNNGWTINSDHSLYYNSAKATVSQVNNAEFMTAKGPIIFHPTSYKAANPDLAALSDDAATQHFIDKGAWQGTQNLPRCIISKDEPSNLTPTETVVICCHYEDDTNNRNHSWALGGDTGKKLQYYGNDADPSVVPGSIFDTNCGPTIFEPADYKTANPDIASLSDADATQDFINTGAWKGTQEPPRCLLKKTITESVNPSICVDWCYSYSDIKFNQDNGWTINSDNSLYYNGVKATIDQVNDAVFMTPNGEIMFNPTDYKRSNPDLKTLTDDEASQHFIDTGAWDGTQHPTRCIIERKCCVATICYNYVDGPDNQNAGWTIDSLLQSLSYNGTTATVAQVNSATFMTNNGLVKFNPEIYKISNPDLMALSNDQATQHFITEGAWEGTQNPPRCFKKDNGPVREQCFSYINDLYNINNGWTLDGTGGKELYYNGAKAQTADVNGAYFMTSEGWIKFNVAVYKASNSDLQSLSDVDAVAQFINEGAWDGTQDPPRCIKSEIVFCCPRDDVAVLCYNYQDNVANQTNGWTLVDNQLYLNNSKATPSDIEGQVFDTSQGSITFYADEYKRINGFTTLTDQEAAQEFIDEGAWQGTLAPPRCIEEKSFIKDTVCYHYLDNTYNHNNGWTLSGTGNKILYLNGSQATTTNVIGASFLTSVGLVTFDPASYRKSNPDLGAYNDTDITQEFINEGAWQGTQHPPRCMLTKEVMIQVPDESYCYNYIDGPDNRDNGWTLKGTNNKTLYFNGVAASINEVIGAVYMTSNGWMMFTPAMYKKCNNDLRSLTDNEAAQEFIDEGAWQGTQSPPRCMNTELYPADLNCYNYIDGPDNKNNGWTLSGTGNKVLYLNGSQAQINDVNGSLFMTGSGWVVFDSAVYKKSNSDLANLSDDDATLDFINQGAWEGTQKPPRCIKQEPSYVPVQPTPPGDCSPPDEAVCYNYIDDATNHTAGWTLGGTNKQELYYKGVKAVIRDVNGAMLMTSQGLFAFDPGPYRDSNVDLQFLTDDEASQQFIDEGAWQGTQTPPRCMLIEKIPSKKVCYNYVDGQANQNNGWTLHGTILYKQEGTNSIAQATIYQVIGATFMTSSGSITFDPIDYKKANKDLALYSDEEATQQFITQGAWEGTKTPARCIHFECAPNEETVDQPEDLICYNYLDDQANQNNGWTLDGAGNKILYYHGQEAQVNDVIGAAFLTSAGFATFDPISYKEANPDLQFLSDTDVTQEFIDEGAWQGTQDPPRCITTRVKPSDVDSSETVCWHYTDWNYNWDNGWTLDGKDQKILYLWKVPARIDEVIGATFMTNAGTIQFDPVEYKRVNPNLQYLSDLNATQYFINQGAWEGTQVPPKCMSKSRPTVCYSYIDGPDNQGNKWTIDSGGSALLYNSAAPALTDVNGTSFYGSSGWFIFEPSDYKLANSDLQGLTDDQATQYFIDQGAYDSSVSNSCIINPQLSICYAYVDDFHNQGNGWTIGGGVLLYNGVTAAITDVNGARFFTSNGWITFTATEYKQYNPDLASLSDDDATTHFINRGAGQGSTIPTRCIINPPLIPETGPRPDCYAYVDTANNQTNGWNLDGNNYQELYYNGTKATIDQVNGKLFWTTMGWIKFNPKYYKRDNPDLQSLSDNNATQHFIDIGAWQGTRAPRRCIYVWIPGIEGCNRYIDGPENQDLGWSLVDVGMITPELTLFSKQLQYDTGDGTGPKRATTAQVQNTYFFSTSGWVKFNDLRYTFDNDDVLVFGADQSTAIDHFIDYGAFESTQTLTETWRCISSRAEGDEELGAHWTRVSGTGNSGDPSTTFSKNPAPGEWSHLPDGSQRVLKTCAAYEDSPNNEQNGWYMSNYNLFYCTPPCDLITAEVNGEDAAVAQLPGSSLYTGASYFYNYNETEFLHSNPDINAVVQTQIYFDGHTLGDFEKTGTQLFTVNAAWEGKFGRCFGFPGRSVFNLGQYIDSAENQYRGFTLCDNTDTDYPFTVYGKHLCVCTNASTKDGCVRATTDHVINNKFFTSRGEWEPFDEYEYKRLNLDVAYMAHVQLWMDGRQVPSYGLFNYSAAEHFIDFGAWEGQYGRNFCGFDYDII